MKTAKALVAAAGLVMASGSALAQRIDSDDLLGVWDTQMDGPGGEATMRIVFVENGTYLSVAIVEGTDEPVAFWEVGEWEVDGDEVSFQPTAASEGSEDLSETIATVEELEDGVLVLSSDEIGELEFEWAVNPVVGTWKAETEEGTAYFAMSCDGGFAGRLGEGRESETFWGTWELDDEDISFTATEEEWTPDGEPHFETHEGTVEDSDDQTLTMLVDGLSDEEIEWERVAMHPLVGDWTGVVDGEAEITLAIDEEGTFEVSMEGEDETFSGIWTIAGQGQLVLAMIAEEGGVEILQFVLTSPDTVMMGQDGDTMEEFTRD